MPTTRETAACAQHLPRRADDVFDTLGPQQQRIATRLFLRLVRVGRSGVEGCRTVPVGELTELGVDPVALSDVLEQFVRHRLLVIGADPVTDRPSVGVAHEALVEEWPRMAPWIDRHRDALRRHEALRSAAISGRPLTATTITWWVAPGWTMLARSLTMRRSW